jgi:gliding motility-associated peptidyl-prolyl isomerase
MLLEENRMKLWKKRLKNLNNLSQKSQFNMKNIPFGFLIIMALFSLVSCKQQQARMPISHSSGTFMNESVERNKKLIKGEEGQIDSIIKSNPKIQYIASKKGYWYHYDVKNDKDTLNPKKGDVALFDYEIKDIQGNVIYSQLELKPQTYIVDKQNIMMGLRDGIKLMRKNETVTFLFPSHMAFGYHGDNRRIGTNEPLMCTVTLTDFKPENKLTQE